MAKEFKSACEECPRFDFCAVNDCPLSLVKRDTSSDDLEVKCTLAKSIRKRIGIKWKLENLGLKPREFSAMQKEALLSPEQKKERLEKLMKNSLIMRLSRKGYKITPKNKFNRENHGQNDNIGLEIAHEGGISND